MWQPPEGLMEVRLQHLTFTKTVKDGDDIEHKARIITYVDIKSGKEPKLVPLLTKDMESDPDEIIKIYRKRWWKRRA